MLTAAYSEGFGVIMGETATFSEPLIRVFWITINGSIVAVDTDRATGSATGTGYSEIMPQASDATLVSDPSRFRRINTVNAYNHDTVTRTFRFTVRKYTAPSTTEDIYMYSASVPSHGTVTYKTESGWTVFNAAGVMIGGGGYNPVGW